MLKLFQQLRKRKTVRDTTALILIKVALKSESIYRYFALILTFEF